MNVIIYVAFPSTHDVGAFASGEGSGDLAKTLPYEGKKYVSRERFRHNYRHVAQLFTSALAFIRMPCADVKYQSICLVDL